MEWEEYSVKFKDKANGYLSDEEINKRLNYALNLFLKNLPIIYDQRHLSGLVGYNINYLLKASHSPEHFYKTYKIPKKAGGFREISEPLPSLKEIQRWILDEILYKCDINDYNKAYQRNISIKDNAISHSKPFLLLKIDIKDYFPSIEYINVYSFYKKLGYCKPVSTLLAKLCCFKNCLPQGAPTSPALSNLITIRIDERISEFTDMHKIKYTRYADDLSFSGNFSPGGIINFVKKVLQEEGFEINKDKIRTMYRNKRQQVTGIVVNEKMQAPREVRRKLRQAVYYIEKFGLQNHLEKIKEERSYYINHLLGIANHIYFINPKDKEAEKYIEILKKHLKSD